MWSRIGQMLKSLYSGMTQLEWGIGLAVVASHIYLYFFGNMAGSGLTKILALATVILAMKWMARFCIACFKFCLIIFRTFEILSGSRYTRW